MTYRRCDECGRRVGPGVNDCPECGGPIRVTLPESGIEYVIRRTLRDPTSEERDDMTEYGMRRIA